MEFINAKLEAMAAVKKQYLEKEFLMMRNQKYKILNINETVMEVEFYE